MIWHVVFHPKQPGQWWARDYGHVSLAGFDNDTWLHLDLYSKGVLAMPVYAHDEVHDYLTYLMAHYTVVKFGEVASPSRSFLHPMSCVSFVKHVLGVRSRALLPDGLIHSLLTDFNAELLNESGRATGNAGAKDATPAG